MFSLLFNVANIAKFLWKYYRYAIFGIKKLVSSWEVVILHRFFRKYSININYKMATKHNQTAEEIQPSKSEQFIQNNGKTVLCVLAGVIVVLAAAVGMNKCSESRNEEAAKSEALYQAQFDFEAGNYAAALENFESVISEYGSTKSGNIAKAYAGLCQKQLGNFDEAINNLKDFDGCDAVISPAILSALGDCYVEKENPDYSAAAKAFEKAASAANSAQFSPLYLRKAGLAYEKLGDNAKALKAYETIKNVWADSDLANSIDKYIVRVK
ncbi:MAG: tetratricopeptide repeat protein [Bacteroidales bacterium]|jgi:tetratricopeptide (TPR) repeat protein|nr:tetratricopeptide repeat protein [Bacteroidales bacterium]